MLFSRDNKLQQSYKNKVHCSEDAEFYIGEDILCKARLRELSWVGATLDEVDKDHHDALVEASHNKTLKVKFILPREFGPVLVDCPRISLKNYQSVSSGEDKIEAFCSLEKEEKVASIREFIVYRNRRFSRHKRKRIRNSILKFRYMVALFFGLAFISLVALFCWYMIKTYIWPSISG